MPINSVCTQSLCPPLGPSGAIRRIWNTQGTDWINLVWVPPSSYYRNGIIIKYVIDLSLSDDVIVDVENPAFNTPNTVNYNITGLSPGTTYTLRVAAATVNGTGPYSYRRRIKTVETGKKYGKYMHRDNMKKYYKINKNLHTVPF